MTFSKKARIRLLGVAGAAVAGVMVVGIGFALFQGEADSANTVAADGQDDIQIQDGVAENGFAAVVNNALDDADFTEATHGQDATWPITEFAGAIDVLNNNDAIGFRHQLTSANIVPTGGSFVGDLTVTIEEAEFDTVWLACNAAPGDTPNDQTPIVGPIAFNSATWIAAGAATELAADEDQRLCFYFTLADPPLGESGSIAYDLTFTSVTLP